MTKYEKIAEWIIGQNVDHSLKSSDIIEIAENEFNTKLTKAGIGYVKEALLDRGYTNLKDSKFKDSPDWETLKKSKDFVLRRLFKELEEEKAKPMSVMKENNIAEIKSEIRKRAKEIKNVPNDIYDSKFKDEKYIVYLNGEPYYTAKSYDEATEIESKLYSASNTDEDFQGYYGSYPDVEIRKVRDCGVKSKDSDTDDRESFEYNGVYVTWDENDYMWYDEYGNAYNGELEPSQVKYQMDNLIFRDSKLKDSDSLVGKKISWDRRALYGVILSENDPLTNKTTIEETSTGKVYFVSTRLLQKAIANGEAKIRDSKFNDAKLKTYECSVYCGNNELECFDVQARDINSARNKAYKLSKNLRGGDCKLFITQYPEDLDDKTNGSLKDAKLTHKQKLWYGEELEKFIYPQYLKRNYTLKRIKRGRKTK